MAGQTDHGPRGDGRERGGRDHHHGHDHDHDHDHHHAPTDVVAEAEARCLARGLRLTDMRRRVLAELAGASRPLGAYDIAATFTQQDGKVVAPVTVYRALDFLLAEGFIHRLESRNAFVACPHSHDASHLAIFLICDTCGTVVEAPSASVRRALDGIAKDAEFAPRARVIEVAGCCSKCRAA